MTRARLPNRRRNESREVTVDGRTCHVMVGFDEADHPREIFIRDAKQGSTIHTLLDDVGVIISIALQSGTSPIALAHSMSRVPITPPAPGDLDRGGDRRAASIIGAAVDLLVEMEGDGG